MSVSIFSYCGEVTIGLMADAALIPDPEEIVRQIETELEALDKLPRARRRSAPRRRRRRSAAVTRSTKEHTHA
jgi:hypothetical protein